ADLRGRSPEALCARLEKRLGTRVDPCVLYVFRCAVYFAEAKRPDSELLKWWNWKDSGRRPAGRGSLRR
ncbi:MAG TPA: helix-hairpin-helix domain-containing protein, partial [Candidatus Sulfotelmatobacter sp.]|nr:helix-hairpin-helix domain-containing protein [Candidatus Sulfotelmatobacter sp.]